MTFDNISGAAALSSMYGLTYTAGGSIDNLVGQPFPSLTLTSGSALCPSYAYCNQYTDAYVDFNLRIGQSALYNFETHNLYNIATGTYGGNASAIALTTNTLTTIRRLLPYGEVLQYVTANSGVAGRYLDRLYRITVAPGSMSYNNTVLNSVYTSNPTDVDFLYPATSTATTDVTAGAAEATDIYSAVAGSTNTNNLSIPETLKVLGGTGGFLRFDVGVATYTWRSVTDGTAAPGAAGTVPTALDAYDITILRTCYTYVADLDGTTGLPDDPGYRLNAGLSNAQLSDLHNILALFAANGMPTANQSYDATTDTHYASGAIGGPADDFRIYSYILRSLDNFDARLAGNGKTYVHSAADRLRVRNILEGQNYWFGYSKVPAIVFDGNNGDFEASVSISSSNNNIAEMNKYYANTLFTVYFNVSMDCDSTAVYAVGTYYDDATPIIPSNLNLTYIERASKQITQDTGYSMNEWIPVRISYNTTAGTYTVSIHGTPLSSLTNVPYDRRSAANRQKLPAKVDYFTISKTNVAQNPLYTGTSNWIDNFTFKINNLDWMRSVGY